MHPEYIKPGFDQAKARLIEEIGEVLQAIGKCDRFGWKNCYPEGSDSNSVKLYAELSDLQFAIDAFNDEFLKKLLEGEI